MNSKTMHTPGPWAFVEKANHGDPFIVTLANQESHPDFEFFDDAGVLVPSEDAYLLRADGRLMAAAPELLDALQTFVNWAIQQNLNLGQLVDGRFCELPVVTNARRAIAKATGAAS